MASVPAPGAKGTTILTGRLGQPSAQLAGEAATQAAATKACSTGRRRRVRRVKELMKRLREKGDDRSVSSLCQRDEWPVTAAQDWCSQASTPCPDRTPLARQAVSR